MNKPSRAKSLKKLIAEFRLTAARAILGNLAHIPLCTSDMHDMSNMAELCEQYSLLIGLNWIATKYSFPVCIESICPDTRFEGLPLLSWPSLANRYPLSLELVWSDFSDSASKLYELMEKSFPANLELLGEIYQQSLSAPLAISKENVPYIDLQSDERASGEFYTPAWVADHAFGLWLSAYSENALPPVKEPAAQRMYRSTICDPSCGTGNFFLAALRILDKGRRMASPLQIEAAGYEPGSAGFQPAHTPDLIEYASKCLYGKDIDGKAIELAKILIAISVTHSIQQSGGSLHSSQLADLMSALDRNLQVGDSLLESCASPSAEKKFDLIITNPPYISFGSRDQQRISKDWQQFLKQRFPASSEYKVRYTSIFQEIGIDLLNPDGQCIYLVPDAFLTGSFYQRLRKLICERVEIIGFTELNESTIPGATVGRWCLAHYKNKTASSNHQRIEPGSAGTPPASSRPRSGGVLPSKNPVRLQSIGIDGLDNYREFQIPLATLISRDKQRFQLIFSKEDLEIVNHCSQYPFLKECIRGHTGIRARNGQASIVAKKQTSKSHHPGIISGSELSAFNISWQGNWIEIVPERLFAGGFDPEIISNPKILVRQTGDRLVAAADKNGLYHLNNVHSFVPAAENPGINSGGINSIYFYTCLLNSSFFLHYYRLKTREHKRALAQIDIETVEHLPLPARDARLESELNGIGKELSNAECNAKEKLLAEMDRLVYRLFGLSKSLQSHISGSIC